MTSTRFYPIFRRSQAAHERRKLTLGLSGLDIQDRYSAYIILCEGYGR
jgi:hypothetical protein